MPAQAPFALALPSGARDPGSFRTLLHVKAALAAGSWLSCLQRDRPGLVDNVMKAAQGTGEAVPPKVSPSRLFEPNSCPSAQSVAATSLDFLGAFWRSLSSTSTEISSRYLWAFMQLAVTGQDGAVGCQYSVSRDTNPEYQILEMEPTRTFFVSASSPPSFMLRCAAQVCPVGTKIGTKPAHPTRARIPWLAKPVSPP